MNDPTIKIILQAIDLATKDIDGVHEKLKQLGDELTKNEFSRSAEGMQAFSDSVKGATQPLADAAKNTLALSAAITGVASYMAGQAYQSAVSYESALADLAKVLDGGMESAKGYGAELNRVALQYGQNGEQLVQSMANFVQAGYDADEAFRLVNESVKLMIAGELDAGAASQELVSILKGFKEPATEAGRAVDILNEVSNKYATNVKELATGMAAISPIAQKMGFSMEETAGLLTPVIEVYQSGSEAADALKTGLQKLTDNAKPVKDALASIGVSQIDLNGNMRSGKEIFLDVATSMVGLSDAQKQYVIGQLVGIEQAGRMSQVFDNLAGYLGITETALASSGSALKEVTTRLETSEVSNQRASESFRQLGVTLGNTLKPQITGVIDATGNLAKAFDGAVKSGDLAPLLNVIKPQIAAVENLFQAMAVNLEGALAGVDWTPLVNGIKELSGEFGDAFAALTDGMDLMTQSGLQVFLQNLINLLGNFTQYVAGIVDGLEPFIDGLNSLFQAVSTNLPGFSNLIGQIQGLSLSINEGLPFILEWGNRIFGVVGAIVDWTVKIGLLIGALKLLSAAGIPVTAMLTGLVTQFLALNPAMAGVLAGLAGMPGLVLALVGAAGGLGVALGTVINKTVEWATGGESIGGMLYDWTHASEGAQLGINGLSDAQNKATTALKDARIEYATGRITLEEYTAALEKYKTAFGGLTEEQVKARAEMTAVNAAYQTGKATLEELVDAQGAYLALFTPTTEAQKAAKSSLDAIVAAQKDGKATLVDVVVEQKKYLDQVNAQVAAELARLKPIKETTEGIKERNKAEQEAADAAANQAKANQAKLDLDNQQNETNDKLKASFAALGLIYDANTGEILHQNQLTAEQRQAQLELGNALDAVGVAAGAMSGRITASGEEMLATFNKIVANSQATSEQITAAFLAMIPRAETNAELDAIRVKIEELARQGKISGDAAATGLDAIRLRAEDLANSSAFGQIIKSIQSIADASIKQADAEGRLVDAQKSALQATYDLAKAKGNEYAARQALIQIAQNEANQATNNARIKNIEAKAAYDVLKLLEQEASAKLAAGQAIDDVTKKRLDSARIAAETAGIEAAAAGQVAEAERQKAAATALGNVGKKEGADANKENTQATGENTAATQKNTEATDQAAKSGGGLAKVVGSLIDFWRQKTRALSEATESLFLYKAGLIGVSNIGFSGMSDDAELASTKIKELTVLIRALEQQMLFSTGSVGYFMDKIQKSGAEAERAYYGQKLAAEALEDQINNVGVSAVTVFGTTAAAANSLTDSVELQISSLNLLNDQDIANLRRALDDANAKLRQMQEETQSARDRLTELNAEILEAQGQDQKAELLRQQLDYQQQLADIEKQRQDAELMGNRELLAILDQQKSKLEELNRIKVENINNENNATTQTTTRTTQLANEAERAANALRAVSSVDLTPINLQAERLSRSFSDLNGVL